MVSLALGRSMKFRTCLNPLAVKLIVINKYNVFLKICVVLTNFFISVLLETFIVVSIKIQNKE